MKDNPNDFTTGRILPKMISFMLPILGALILQAMYGAVDILIVGRFGSTAGISGVSTGSNLINMVTFVIAGFSTGITVLIARYIGEKHEELIGRVVGGAICFFTVLSVILAVLLFFLARPLSLLLKAPEEAVDLTVSYIRICGLGIFFIVAYNIISCIFRGLGDSRTPLLFVLVACLVNIAGDLFFVAVLKMNVAGAAIATVMAQAVSVIISIIYMLVKKSHFTIKKGDISFNEQIKIFSRIGIPMAIQELLTQISFMALLAFINALGLEASSGYGVANKIVSFVMLVPSSLMQSMGSFVSQNVGAGNEKRAKKAMLTGMAIGGTIGIAVFIFIMLRAELLAEIFSTDPAVIVRGAEYLRGFGPEAVVTAILFSFIGYFSGHQKTWWVMAQGLLQTFLVRLPVSYIMSIQPNASLTNIGYAAPLATVFGILINVIAFIIFNKKIKKD